MHYLQKRKRQTCQKGRLSLPCSIHWEKSSKGNTLPPRKRCFRIWTKNSDGNSLGQGWHGTRWGKHWHLWFANGIVTSLLNFVKTFINKLFLLEQFPRTGKKISSAGMGIIRSAIPYCPQTNQDFLFDSEWENLCHFSMGCQTRQRSIGE